VERVDGCGEQVGCQFDESGMSLSFSFVLRYVTNIEFMFRSGLLPKSRKLSPSVICPSKSR